MAKNGSPRWSLRECSAEAGDETAQMRVTVRRRRGISCHQDSREGRWPACLRRDNEMQFYSPLPRLGRAPSFAPAVKFSIRRHRVGVYNAGA